MHYKNGREAKNGDKVVLIPGYGAPTIGILYDATVGNDHCNGRIAAVRTSDLHRYLIEQEFRFNNRTEDDGFRFASALAQVSGKRLTYS